MRYIDIEIWYMDISIYQVITTLYAMCQLREHYWLGVCVIVRIHLLWTLLIVNIWHCALCNSVSQELVISLHAVVVSHEYLQLLIQLNYNVSGKKRPPPPPKHVKITLWIESDSYYFSICDVYVKFHDN